MTAGYVEFEFDLPSALLAKLIDVFDSLDPAPMNADTLDDIPDAQGVYQLFHADPVPPQLVYIGKTDMAAGLRKRLTRHAGKLEHRIGLSRDQVFFKAVRVYVFTAVDLETQLIGHYGGVTKVSWNGSGFGSNDTGKERDTTKFKLDHFDSLFPIDTHRQLEFGVPTTGSAGQILTSLKRGLPWVFRFESAAPRSRVPHLDLQDTEVVLDTEQPLTAESVISQTVLQLPSGWHATALPSHTIMYKNDTRKFPSGRLIARSPD